ncbi:YwqG family protein [Flavobacterium ginsenosidimutans]|uniref:YwqG family protein n=1 Tax=Flavobacterium ginsenosidimutans TaxID=687844 RepID=A0ABZ2QCT5_9FLAO
MNIEEFKNKLDQNGLGKYFEKLKPFFRSAIRFYDREIDESAMVIGQTKIGGRPDLPKGINWFTETNTIERGTKFLFFDNRKKEIITIPLSFIAQINFSEVSVYDKEGLLPNTGILYFFYCAEQDAWGFDFKDKNKFKTFYWNGNFEELKRCDFPIDLPKYSRFKPTAVEIKHEVNLPCYEDEIYEELEDGEDEKFWEKVYYSGSINKLLGYSDNIQGEMELECELVTNGLYCGDPSGYNDPRAESLEKNAKDWLLLLQIDSNEKNEMMWGDGGRLYFWIKKEDLSKINFENTWFSLQCS